MSGTPASMEEYQKLAEKQRARAILHTRADTWRTAAIMTCLVPPLGLPFGLVALLLLRGVGAAIDGDRADEAARKLALGRGLALVGTVLGALALLLSLAQMLDFALGLMTMGRSEELR
jgi:hypothetical protein